MSMELFWGLILSELFPEDRKIQDSLRISSCVNSSADLTSLGFHWCASIPAFTPDGFWGLQFSQLALLVLLPLITFASSIQIWSSWGQGLSYRACITKERGADFVDPARTEVSSHQYLLRFSVCTCSVQERQGGKKTRKSSLALFHIFHFKCKEWGVSSLSRLIVVQGTAEIEDLHTSVEMHNHLVLCGRAGRCKLHLFASGCVTH